MYDKKREAEREKMKMKKKKNVYKFSSWMLHKHMQQYRLMLDEQEIAF